jgi:UDP-N-acetylglucosamine 2-epimerase (non-hydrolysing)
MRISIILGTRPEIVKFSPIIRECEHLGLDYFVIHTGQHYSYNMARVFFEQLELPQPEYNLDVGSGTHAEQTGKMLIGTERVLLKEKPDVVLVEGDTNTVLAGALAAVKVGIQVGHVEAGLRSYDRMMPEEINRSLVDHCSDLLFAPTEKSRRILIREGILANRIFVTGNTIVDAVHQNLEISRRRLSGLGQLGVNQHEYCLATVHRQENVDDKGRFQGILKGLEKVNVELGLPMVYPVHPRAVKQLKAFSLKPEGIRTVDSLDYLSFLLLESHAKLILTDSGGVQEEACILGVPCVTLRYNTERPETLEVGSNVLAGADPENILSMARLMLDKRPDWKNPFGGGHSGEEIIRILRENSST